jgi:glycosyltransferase involved in cell wall biosynthesis
VTRVVFLTHNYPRFAGDVAGAFLATLAQALVQRGLQVRVVAPSDGGNIGAPELDGIPVRRVRYAAAADETIAYKGTMADAIGTLRGWRSLIGLRRALREGARAELRAGATLIHAHWWVPAGLAAPPEAPMVLTVHGTDAVLLTRSALARLVARPVIRRARVVTAVSTTHAGWVTQATGREIPPSRIQPMPVDLPPLERSGGGDGLVVVSRLTEQKRVHLALEAAAALSRAGRPLALTIVGDGPERAALERLAGRLGPLGPVRFEGMVPPAQVARVLAAADVLLFPARAEGFGLSAAEALMSGVPVVACLDGGGVLDIVPERGAGRRVVPTGDALASAVLDLLADPSVRGDAWRLGLEWRKRLAPDAVAAAFEECYREAAGA